MRPSAVAGGRALIGVFAMVVAVMLARSLWLPPVWHLPVALGLTAATVVIGRRAGLGATDLGLGSWRRGAVVGAIAVAVVVVALAIAAAVAPSIGQLSELFEDERAAIDLAELLVRAIVIIPVGTVLVEEMIFRGVVLGLLLEMTNRRRAVIVSAVVFGLWHLVSVGLATSGSAAVVAGAVIATFVVTTLAGLVFAGLRLVSGSLLAPVMAHTATNSGALVTAWIVA